MNIKAVFNILGRMAQVEALLMLLPTAAAVYYKEYTVIFAFLAVAAAAFVIGTLVKLIVRPKSTVIYAKEGFAVVALSWLLFAAIGAVPFTVSGDIPSYVDAFFEMVSGFTTTGSSILKDVEALSHGALFWRSFSHWIGGMGVLVFVMAIIPNISDRSIHILKAEVPGPVVGKLVPRIKDTAKILYIIYIVLTLTEIAILYISGMPLFDSLLHSFGTAGTGGFGIRADSIGSYSPLQQWVIAIFMLIFGVNFNIYYLILLRRFRSVFKSGELWCYISMAVVAVGIISANTMAYFEKFSDTLRHSVFQVASIITTTGYATTDFDLWPDLSKAVLLLLMFTGACAGSTAGGLKISRVILLFKMIGREFKKMLHPRSVSAVRFEGKTVDEATINSTAVYFALYMVCLLTVFFLISFESAFDFESNFTAALTCFNNVGPGFAAVGPTLSFADYSAFSKMVLSAAMLLGRLEIIPLLITLFPSTWTRKG